MITHNFDADDGKRPLGLIKHLKITTYPFEFYPELFRVRLTI